MRSQPKLLLHSVLLLCIICALGCNSNIRRSKDLLPPASISPPTPDQQAVVSNSRAPIPRHSLQSPEEIQLRLHAIESLIASGDSNSAKDNADAIDADALSVDQQTQLSLLYAQVLLNFGEAEQAIEKLASVNPANLDQNGKITFFQSQAFAYSLIGNLRESAKARIELQRLLPAAKQPENQAAILEALRLLPESALRHAENIEISGWMSLATLSKQAQQPDFADLIAQWRNEFPGHIANPALLEQPADLHDRAQVKADAIAILLPETGPYAEAGKALSAGFKAALNATKSAAKLRFYDTSQSPADRLYSLAISEGASLVIGPLDKESIGSIGNLPALTIPVLALNQIEGLYKDKLYQFALSPMDEVEQLVNKAHAEGHLNALSLVPDNAVGERAQKYFADNWNNVDGKILEVQKYNVKNNDYSQPLKKLLNLDESESRFQRLSTLLPDIKFTPRVRKDADALLLNARPQEARMINPLLKFYQANELQIYAMSTIYSGLLEPALDADLNGIVFCDIPWFFDNAYLGLLPKNSSTEYWRNISNEYLRLYAMGIDAFQLSAHINELNYLPSAGATGTLSQTDANRIKRTLVCASFKRGKPELFN